MNDIEEIKAELSGNTNFDEKHEGELFKRIAEFEEQERAGELVRGLNKVDYVLAAIMFAVLGLLPVVWYAIRYF